MFCLLCFSPLVEEKLELEGDAMSSIQMKQDETDDELSRTLQRLAATDRKTAEAQGKASQERALIKQDVDVVRNELNAVRCVFVFVVVVDSCHPLFHAHGQFRGLLLI